MTSISASIAASRFGMGPRPGELAEIGKDGPGWLGAQIRQTQPLPAALQAMPSGGEYGRQILDSVTQRRQMGDNEEAKKQAQKATLFDLVRIYQGEAIARTQAAIDTPSPFFERLVQFWSNHFTVSVTKQQVRGLAGAFEREAIRPYVLGSVRDMLQASSRHVAMLTYLDQAQSIGPNSMAGKFGRRGLNENLAREIMELHTLGVDGGYNQEDVQAFARILTGWTVGGVRRLLPPRLAGDLPDRDDGDFLFVDLLHEPGPKTLLGRTFQQAGEDEGTAALDMLAMHPATARHIATKLARHFISDDPPASAIGRLQNAFTTSRGNLQSVTYELLRMPEVWSQPLTKVRSPNDFVIAIARASALPIEGQLLVKALREFGQSPYSAPSPAGWADDANAWLAPEALKRRIQAARQVAAAMPSSTVPMDLLQASIGPVANADTVLWVQRAPDRVEGLSLIFASPEFQRR